MHDHETSAKHFRRNLTRWYKFFKHMPISLDDISAVKMSDQRGTSYEARRDTAGSWVVYRIYHVKYDKTTSRIQHETQGIGLSIGGALELLRSNCPEGMSRNKNDFDHPVQVAKLIHYEFAPLTA